MAELTELARAHDRARMGGKDWEPWKILEAVGVIGGDGRIWKSRPRLDFNGSHGLSCLNI